MSDSITVKTAAHLSLVQSGLHGCRLFEVVVQTLSSRRDYFQAHQTNSAFLELRSRQADAQFRLKLLEKQTRKH